METNDFFGLAKYYSPVTVSITNAYELIPDLTYQNPTAFSGAFNVTDTALLHELIERHTGLVNKDDKNAHDLIAYVFQWHQDEYNELNEAFNRCRKSAARKRARHQIKHNLTRTFKPEWFTEDFFKAYQMFLDTEEYKKAVKRYSHASQKPDKDH